MERSAKLLDARTTMLSLGRMRTMERPQSVWVGVASWALMLAGRPSLGVELHATPQGRLTGHAAWPPATVRPLMTGGHTHPGPPEAMRSSFEE